MTYEKLNDQDYRRVWDAFDAKFAFKPDYYASNPAIVEPAGSIVFRFKSNFDADEIDALDDAYREAFAVLTPQGESMYALDWQHDAYRFDPHGDYRHMPISVFPDGDYFIFLNERMDMGTFGHPWQSTVCVFGRELVAFVESKVPSIFERVERRNAQQPAPAGGLPLAEPERWHQKKKLINPVETPDGTPRSFYTYKIPFERLCRCIASCPGVEFTCRPRFFWSGLDVFAEFRFKGHDFRIDEIWADTHVSPKDQNAAYPEIVEIEKHVEEHGHSPVGRWLSRFFDRRLKCSKET